MASVAAYGTWTSPITPAVAAAGTGRPEFVGIVGDEVWWTVPRPDEGGRRTLVRRRGSGRLELPLPAPWNARNSVHEYGGHPWTAIARERGGPMVVFTHFADQRLYVFEPDVDGRATPRPLTPTASIGGGLRWCSPLVMPDLGEVWCVLEEFTGERPGDVRRVLAAVPLDGAAAKHRSRVRELTDDGDRFVTGPQLSRDGRRAAWLAWNHPLMPWEATELKIAEVSASGDLTAVRTVPGVPGEAVAQVEWAADGSLLVASDRTGWWNIHRVDPETGRAENLCPRAEEFAAALWRIGLRWFCVLDDARIAVIHGNAGTALGVLDTCTGELTDVTGDRTEWAKSLDGAGDRVIGVPASLRSSYEVVEVTASTGSSEVIGNAYAPSVPTGYLPEPQARVFRGEGGHDVHALIHPPRNPDFAAPDGELPPYLIWVHGGPTGHVPIALDLEIAFFTSRGFGVAAVEYGGSTGYGRAYRERLRGQWGLTDVADCAVVAKALADEGSADRDRVAIRGASAGGFTTALSLTSPAVSYLYACGTIVSPVLDLLSWATGETHDFESHYCESLIGRVSEVPERYRERSPLHQAHELRVPFVLMQGLDDEVCPPAQCHRFLQAVDRDVVPHAYLAFAGEGHGFRRAETIVQALAAELSLYAQTFGFTAPDIPVLQLRTGSVPRAASSSR